MESQFLVAGPIPTSLSLNRNLALVDVTDNQLIGSPPSAVIPTVATIRCDSNCFDDTLIPLPVTCSRSACALPF